MATPAPKAIDSSAPLEGAGRAGRDCFLDVERSLLGKRWEARAGDDRLALALSQRLDLPEVVGRILAARGVALDQAERFLAPTLRDSMPDPGGLRDMAPAVADRKSVV